MELRKKIPTFTPKNLNDNEFLNKLKKFLLILLLWLHMEI